MTFDDEFSGTSLDTTKWESFWWVSGADANGYSHSSNTLMIAGYSESDVYMSGGYLNLKMDNTAVTTAGTNYAFTGSTITTHSLFSQVGGCFEARFYLPANASGQVYGWPAWWIIDSSWHGELDILEAGAIASGVTGGTAVNIHWSGGNPGWTASSPYSGWHAFGVNWDTSAKTATFYWDGAQVWSPQSFEGSGALPKYMILTYQMANNQVQPPAGGAIMRVDWVRAWQPKP